MKAELTIQSLLFPAFEKYKNNIAVSYGDMALTYEEINKITTNIAANLKSKDDEIVIIACKSKVTLIAGLIACLKSKKIFLPLDMTASVERNILLLDTIEYSSILIDDDTIVDTLFPNINKDDVFIIDILDDTAMSEFDFKMSNYSKDDPISIFFTSGSTGHPKAIIGKNCSLAHFIAWEIKEFNIDETSVVSQLTSPSHDPILRDIFIALCSGGRVAIPEFSLGEKNTEYFIDWVCSESVSIIHIVPSFFHEIMKLNLLKYDFSNLHKIIMAGERILITDLEKWFELGLDHIALFNFYGPTETTMIKTFHQITEKDLKKDRIPIGKPLPDTEIIILDENNNICETNIIGEIYIKTEYMSLGYYNNYDNENAFVPNPFLDGNVLYKTGDIGRLMEDGNLDFIERLDRQIKLRGVRIELGEVEAVLQKSSLVEECAASVAQDDNGLLIGIRIYYVSNGQSTENEIKNFLFGHYSDSLSPVSFVKVNEIAKLKNGKTDYKTLENNIEPVKIEKATNDTEQKLIDIWKRILDIDEVGINQEFRELGGHSLNIMTLVTSINREFGIEIPLADIFNKANIRHLAKIINSRVNREVDN